MVQFNPISPSAARQILTGISEADAGEFLSAFVEAGRVRAYAEVIETLPLEGGRTQLIDARIPTLLWRRLVAEGHLTAALTMASVKLKGDGLVGGIPAVTITGIRFNPGNVHKVAAQHGPTPPSPPSPSPAPTVSPIGPGPVGAAAAKTSAKPKTAPSTTPPLIQIMETPPSAPETAKPAEQLKAAKPTKVRRGLPADAVTVTIAEACEILGVSRTKLNELMKTDLEVKRIGRSVKIKAQSIREYMDRP